MTPPLDPTDLERVLEACERDLRELAGARLFVTGGTGFVGTWLMESLVHASRRLGLRITAVVVAREPAAFAARSPHLAAAGELRIERADVRDLSAFDAERFDGFIHAATPADAAVATQRPYEMLDTIYDGTRRVLECAERSGDVPFLFTSSGAVYGTQAVPHVDEDAVTAPDPLHPANIYHEGKRVAEMLCALAAARGTVRPKIARPFAFAGPHLPLDRHFAIGNFVADALAGRPITVTGDGTAVRSYLYASDLAIWLWRIFVRGRTGRAYNVGSERAYDLATVARRVAALAPAGPSPVRVLGSPAPFALPHRYVPATSRARDELDLVESVDLDESIRRWLAWHGPLRR